VSGAVSNQGGIHDEIEERKFGKKQSKLTTL